MRPFGNLPMQGPGKKQGWGKQGWDKAGASRIEPKIPNLAKTLGKVRIRVSIGIN